MSEKKTGLTRRGFLGTSGAAILGGAVLSQGVLNAAPGKATDQDALPRKWDETFDVVVVGSGFAALAAAIEAKKAGSSVAVLEKMKTAGGNSIINGGIFAVAGSPLQAKMGIKDSPELMAQDMIKAGLGLNHPDLVKLICEKSVEAFDWTVNELGMKFQEGEMVQEGGHTVQRSIKLPNSSGAGLVLPELAKLKSLGVEPRTQTLVTKIYRDKDGRVKGVQVREGYAFPKADSGKVKNIKARRAVVLAHGGFSQDVAYRMIQDPKLTAKFESTNQPGATSEMWREASRIGCNLIQGDWIQVGPWASPDEKGFGLAPHFAQEAAAMYGLWLNAKTGKRFVDELANRKVRADAIMMLMNKGENCIAFADSYGVSRLTKGIMDKLIQRGVVKKYDTLEDVASAYSMPLDAFKETIAKYNKNIREGVRDDVKNSVTLPKEVKPVETAPYYVSRLLPKVHHCMGGIYTNTAAQAMDVSTDKPIPSLYAAGESTGGVHGAVRLGSCAITDCIVMGRVAGQNAAKEKPWG
ncbi:flavocytochrome c [Holophaga foetida]|uniref:flavocytochrome c n=1 Tax=Holophaga foetida TaxID=35839 RepID=UPI00024725D4|nr:flavocytochrome c [Holophaga foetida]